LIFNASILQKLTATKAVSFCNFSLVCPPSTLHTAGACFLSYRAVLCTQAIFKKSKISLVERTVDKFCIISAIQLNLYFQCFSINGAFCANYGKFSDFLKSENYKKTEI